VLIGLSKRTAPQQSNFFTKEKTSGLVIKKE